MKTDLELTADGHRVRLRYGRGLRARFLIRTLDEAVAERRATKLRVLAAQLATSGRSAEAHTILTATAGATNDQDFEAYIKIGEDFCRKAKASDVKASKTGRAQASTMTFAKLATEWTSGKLAQSYPDHVAAKKTAPMDATRLELIGDVKIAPGLRFGDLPLPSITLDHVETVMANLPKTAKRSATRRGYAQVLSRVLGLAVFPCRLLASNPLPRGFLPKTGKPPGFTYLYPNEDAALLGWNDERAEAAGVAAERPGIPLGRRLLWGFLAREGLRSGEALGLRVGTDVDLERGAVRLSENKTDDPRAWALDASVAAALRAYVKRRELKPGQLLFTDEKGAELVSWKLAPLLRADLEAAGVTRSELHEDGENTRKLRVHDLRGTFVTLSLANGKTETWVADRTGHRSSQMINRYRRAARTAAELGLGALAPLESALPELAAKPAQGGPKGGPKRPLTGRKKSATKRNDSVGRLGLEPRTNGLKIRCSNQLSYRPDGRASISQGRRQVKGDRPHRGQTATGRPAHGRRKVPARSKPSVATPRDVASGAAASRSW
jgi:integrase